MGGFNPHELPFEPPFEPSPFRPDRFQAKTIPGRLAQQVRPMKGRPGNCLGDPSPDTPLPKIPSPRPRAPDRPRVDQPPLDRRPSSRPPKISLFVFSLSRHSFHSFFSLLGLLVEFLQKQTRIYFILLKYFLKARKTISKSKKTKTIIIIAAFHL